MVLPGGELVLVSLVLHLLLRLLDLVEIVSCFHPFLSGGLKLPLQVVNVLLLPVFVVRNCLPFLLRSIGLHLMAK